MGASTVVATPLSEFSMMVCFDFGVGKKGQGEDSILAHDKSMLSDAKAYGWIAYKKVQRKSGGTWDVPIRWDKRCSLLEISYNTHGASLSLAKKNVAVVPYRDIQMPQPVVNRFRREA